MRHRSDADRNADAARYEGQERRDAARQHRRAGDQMFDGWTWARFIKIGTAMGMVWAAYVGLNAYVATRIASRQELNTITDRVDALERLERSNADSAAESRRMLRGIAKLMCKGTDRETAAFVDLPCDQLGTPARPTR